MGGLMFYLGTVAGVVAGYAALVMSAPMLFERSLVRRSDQLDCCGLTSFAFGFVGFLDDFVKDVKSATSGLMARYKICIIQIVITAAFFDFTAIKRHIDHVCEFTYFWCGRFRLFLLSYFVYTDYRYDCAVNLTEPSTTPLTLFFSLFLLLRFRHAGVKERLTPFCVARPHTLTPCFLKKK